MYSINTQNFGGATALRAHLLHDCEFKSLQLIDVVALSPWGSPFFKHVRQHEAAFSGVPDYIHTAIVTTYIEGGVHQSLSSMQMTQFIKPWLSDEGKPAFYRQIAQADQKYTDEIEPCCG